MLWDANKASEPFSSMYDESWVEKLYWGFRRNLTVRFRFICFTDRERELPPFIHQMRITSESPAYNDFTEPYKLNRPMILVGLDTIVVSNIDHYVQYCLTANKTALPAAIYRPKTVCNGVALVPSNQKWIFDEWNGENDMKVMRDHYANGRVEMLDKIFPNEIVSYKKHVKPVGRLLPENKIVFFHGKEKPHELNEPWIREHWRCQL